MLKLVKMQLIGGDGGGDGAGDVGGDGGDDGGDGDQGDGRGHWWRRRTEMWAMLRSITELETLAW